MNYKKGLKIIKETTLSGGTTFGTAPGIGQHGGDVGNSDFFARGNSMNLYGGIMDPDRPYGRKKRGKKGRGKNVKFPLYRRQFAELMATESNESMDLDDLRLDCVVRFPDSDCTQILEKILSDASIQFIHHRGDLVSFQETDENIRNIINRLSSIVGDENMFVMIGEMEENQIVGGKADNKTVEDIARRHGVSVEEINKQLEIGIKVELEHTNDKKLAREIALDHLWEFPNYYTELQKFEDKLKKQNG